jgi:hypothetical protein
VSYAAGYLYPILRRFELVAPGLLRSQKYNAEQLISTVRQVPARIPTMADEPPVKGLPFAASERLP